MRGLYMVAYSSFVMDCRIPPNLVVYPTKSPLSGGLVHYYPFTTPFFDVVFNPYSHFCEEYTLILSTFSPEYE